jgi:hypothetical protein
MRRIALESQDPEARKQQTPFKMPTTTMSDIFGG